MCYRSCVWNPASGLLQIGHKSQNDNDVRIFLNCAIVNFFWRCCVLRVKFTHWFKFHINTIISVWLIAIFVCKGLTRNAEIRSTPLWVLTNILRLAQIRDTKFDTNISNKRLLNAGECKMFVRYQGKTNRGDGKGGGGGVKTTLPPTRLRLIGFYFLF